MVLNPRCAVWKYFDNIIEEGVAVCKLCKQRLKNDRSFSLKKHISKLHNPNSEIWKHFDNIVDEGVAVCKICHQRVRNNRHFNLSLHLKQHGIIVNTTDKENQSTSKKLSNINNNLNAATVIGNLYVEMDEKTLVGAVMGLMVEEGIASQIFSSKNMQNLLSPVCDAISKQEVTRFHIDEIQSERVIASVANHIRNEFCNDFHWRLLSLKIDMDLNAIPKTFCLSVQFINDIQVETRNLGVITLKEHENLSGQYVMEILQQFNIDSKQIVSACWDNTKENFNRSVENSEYFKEIEKFYKSPDIYVGDLKIERYVGVIGQLCVLDVLKNPIISALFLQCRNLTKIINENSNIFYGKFEQNNLKIPQLDSPWKWGSTYTMMNDLNEARSVLENIKYEQAEDQFSLNDNLWNFIEAFCKSLKFMQKSVVKFYNEEMIFGNFYAQWLKCKLVTEKLLNTNNKQENHLKVILSELFKSIESRSDELLNQDYFKACLYLDPRFKHTLNLPEKMFAMEYLKQLWDRSKIYNAELVDPVPDTRTQIFPLAQQADDDEDACLNEFLCQGVQNAESSGIYKKLEELKLPFQNVETNILQFWRDQRMCEPEIYTLSTICFAMPATQIYNKISYSNFNQTSNVSSYVKGNLAFLRLNQHLLDNAIQKLGLFRMFREYDSSDNELSEVSVENSGSLSTINTMTVRPSSSAGGSVL